MLGCVASASKTVSRLQQLTAALSGQHGATPGDSGVGGLEQQQPKLRRLDPDCFSRTILLRGGADASVAVGDENTHETINCRTDGTKDGLEDTTVGLGAESAAESEDADKRSKRWLLKATEHDRQISALALPALLSLLVDPILSLVDTAYVGRGLGSISLAALGPCTSIFHFSFNTFRSLTQSTTTLVSKSLAADDKERAGQIVTQMYVLACVLGAGLQITLLTQAPSILALMGAGPSTALFTKASAYLKVRALAAPAVLLIMVSEGVFRGHANTRAPALAALCAAAANVVMDPIFMFALSMGIAGAAGATAFAQYLAVATYGVMLWRGARGGSMVVPFLFSRRQREEKKTAAASIGDGSKAAIKAWPLLVTVISANAAMLLRTTSLMTCWAVATATAARMSSESVAAHQVGLSMWLLFALVAEAPSIAAQVLGARHIAQGKLDTARSMGRRVTTLTLACSGFLGAALFTLGWAAPRCFTSDPAVLGKLSKLLPLLSVQQPLIAMTLVTEGLLIGAGQFRWLAATTGTSSVLAAGFIVQVGRRVPHWDVLGIWGGITAMFCFRLLAAAWRLSDRKRGPYWVLGSDANSAQKNS
eukprot:jgi/Undpi1/11226/HiC_scaffold_30.g13524.m1